MSEELFYRARFPRYPPKEVVHSSAASPPSNSTSSGSSRDRIKDKDTFPDSLSTLAFFSDRLVLMQAVSLACFARGVVFLSKTRPRCVLLLSASPALNMLGAPLGFVDQSTPCHLLFFLFLHLYLHHRHHRRLLIPGRALQLLPLPPPSTMYIRGRKITKVHHHLLYAL